ncbi:MAG: phosphatase PAP2 family protein [Myxococcota bacterium]|jgi:undecaprenyl-diphosphatase|nr:phosphatase PAP2 family protein [Myxococcota bacterium]
MRTLVVIHLLTVASVASAQSTTAPAPDESASPSAEAEQTEASNPDEPVGDSPTEPITVPQGPAYHVDLEIDIPMLIIPGVLMLGWPLSDTMPPPHCAPLCDPAGLNPIDRPAAGLYSEAWSMASDIGVGVLLASAVAVPFIDEAPMDALNDIIVIAQAIAWTEALAILTAMASRRPRPVLYSEKAPLEMRNDPDTALSFFSGHTGTAFAASTAIFQTLRRRHPDSALPWVALAVGDAIGIMVAVGRVKAGRHFPTDVIAAALVGTGVGLLIPALHDHPIQVTPMALQGGAGVAVGGAF